MTELIEQTQARGVLSAERHQGVGQCDGSHTHSVLNRPHPCHAQYAFGAKEPSSTLHLIEFTPKPLGDLDVFVDVTHCGMCHSDLHKVLDEWHDACRYPMVPGHEVVGVVSKIGTRGERWGSERALFPGACEGRETARTRAVGGLGARPPPAALPLC